MTSHCHQTLREKIFELSEEKKDWIKACMEWEIHPRIHSPSKTITGKCICTHDIEWDYWIFNHENGNETHVGSKCIFQFMKENDQLILDMKAAKLRYGKKPCLGCGKLTRVKDQLHKRCVKIYNERLERKEREKKYSNIMDRISARHLSTIEVNFITESVYNAIMSGKQLSRKQSNWLDAILSRHASYILT